jgi:hypothetical protein
MALFDNPPLRDFPDRALREALGHRHNLQDAVRAALPQLAGRLDFERAGQIQPQFRLEDWRGRESDLLFLIPYRGGEGAAEVLVCLLLEHQSRADPRLPLRLLVYAVLFWEQEWKQWEAGHPEGQPLVLTPVIPLVLHTSASPWGSSTTLAQLFAGPQELRAFAPSWPVTFWDLAQHTPGELLALQGPFLQLLSLVRAEGRDAPAFRDVFQDLLVRLEPLAGQDTMRWRDLLWLAFSWVLQRRPAQERQGLFDLARDSQRDAARRQEVQAMLESMPGTWAAEVEALALARGEAQGVARGQLEGERRGLRESVAGFLSARFGALPEPLAEQIRACEDVERLRAAVTLAARVKSLDEFTL